MTYVCSYISIEKLFVNSVSLVWYLTSTRKLNELNCTVHLGLVLKKNMQAVMTELKKLIDYLPNLSY